MHTYISFYGALLTEHTEFSMYLVSYIMALVYILNHAPVSM